jgi:hypothetical protein
MKLYSENIDVEKQDFKEKTQRKRTHKMQSRYLKRLIKLANLWPA